MIGVLRFPGSCDEVDALKAAEKVDDARLLWHQETDLGEVDAVIVPGGFSYGDYLRCGAIARFSPIMGAVGICNGFQVLCEARLLPGALLPNQTLRFVCRQVDVEVTDAGTPFTHAATEGERLSIPVKHTTGCYFAPPEQIDDVRVALRYAPGENPNGSLRNIAGVVSEAGNVMGLMPHPEHAVDALEGSADGLKLFQSMAARVAA